MKKNTLLIRFSRSPYLILILACLLAWMPLLREYRLLADDYTLKILSQFGIQTYLSTWLAAEGVWRILGCLIIGILLNLYPLIPPLIILTCHIISGLLLYYTCCNLFRFNKILSLSLSLIHCVFPFSYQALTWVSGSQIILATICFQILLVLFLNPLITDKFTKLQKFIVGFSLVFFAQLVQENLIFSFIFVSIPFLLTNNNLRNDQSDRVSTQESKSKLDFNQLSIGSIVGGFLFLLLYKLTLTTYSLKVPTLNLGSIISPYFHMYSLGYIFQPWLHSETRHFIFFDWSFVSFVFVIILTIFLVLAGYKHLRSIYKFANANQFVISNNLKKFHLFVIVSLGLGASFIYAFAGFSLDTRKKYPLVICTLLVIGWISQHLISKYVSISFKSIFATILATCIVGISTTWLVLGVYNYDLARQHQLIDYLITNRISGDIRLLPSPDIKALWKTFPTTLGFDFYESWVLGSALNPTHKTIQVKDTSTARTIYFNQDSGWFEKL